MSDGAHQGVDAERALGTILGGESQPTEAKEGKTTPLGMLMQIRAASESPDNYGDAATSYARVILEAYEANPALRSVPLNTVYKKDADGKMIWENDHAVVLQHDIYDALKELHPDENCWQRKVMSSLSGFMVGWANNAVRYALGDPPVPNPARVTIEE